MSAAWPFLLRKRKDQGKRKRPPCRWPVHSASTSERASQPRSRGTAIINGSSSIRTGKRRRSRIAPALSRTTLGCCVRLRWPALASCSFRVLWSGKTSAPGVLSMSCRNGNRAAPSSMRCSHRGTVCSLRPRSARLSRSRRARWSKRLSNNWVEKAESMPQFERDDDVGRLGRQAPVTGSILLFAPLHLPVGTQRARCRQRRVQRPHGSLITSQYQFPSSSLRIAK
jgi:hypothetical protein